VWHLNPNLTSFHCTIDVPAFIFNLRTMKCAHSFQICFAVNMPYFFLSLNYMMQSLENFMRMRDGAKTTVTQGLKISQALYFGIYGNGF
jgi:hypothetical protein